MLSDHNAHHDSDVAPEDHKEAQDGNSDAKDWSQTIKNLLEATQVVLERSKVSFFVYKMDGLDEIHRKIDENNIQMFYRRCILDRDFQRKYNCMRIFLQRAQADFLRMSEDDYEIMVKSAQLLILNSKYEEEYGALQDVELVLKVPRKK